MTTILCHPGPFVVYILRDAEGEVLYIGWTVNIERRLQQHRRERPWFREVAQVDLQMCDSYWDADDTEKTLIRRHQPPHNLMHTVRWSEWLVQHPSSRYVA